MIYTRKIKDAVKRIFKKTKIADKETIKARAKRAGQAAGKGLDFISDMGKNVLRHMEEGDRERDSERLSWGLEDGGGDNYSPIGKLNRALGEGNTPRNARHRRRKKKGKTITINIRE